MVNKVKAGNFYKQEKQLILNRKGLRCLDNFVEENKRRLFELMKSGKGSHFAYIEKSKLI